MKDRLACILIDDEAKCRSSLKNLLQSYCPEVEIIAEANDRLSMLEVLKRHDADLVFSDIELGSFLALDILDEIDSKNFEVVFVTAHENYAVQGYKYDALDYLLKPVSIQSLKRIVHKALAKKKSLETVTTEGQFVLSTTLHNEPTIAISDNKRLQLIKIKDILFCHGQGNYTFINRLGGEQIVSSKNLKFNESKLSAYNFIRIHKSYLINLAHLDHVDKEQGGSVVLSDQTRLPLSKTYKKTFFNIIAEI